MRPSARTARLLLSAAIGLILIGCGTATGRRAGGRSDLLTRAEIAAQHWSDAYSLVEALRPRWLSMRGPDSIQGEEVPVQVYLDGSRLGGATLLRTIPVQDIQRMEFLSGVEASSRYGVGHTNGAILVYTRTQLGVEDNLHFSPAGAALMARLAVEWLRATGVLKSS